MSKEDLDAAINLIAAVNAGVIQAIARRGYEHVKESCGGACEPGQKK
ncbi:MAG: hypothetical protein HYY23_16715 [Verrucomicrobia bacterium]|nr:hypothetical protein [Verrucomicrobiota bacterium]